jgi:hypothetical protein
MVFTMKGKEMKNFIYFYMAIPLILVVVLVAGANGVAINDKFGAVLAIGSIFVNGVFFGQSIGLRKQSKELREIARQYERDHQRYEEVYTNYYELLYEVARKFPNETRHQTALRYIRNAEIFSNELAKCEVT